MRVLWIFGLLAFVISCSQSSKLGAALNSSNSSSSAPGANPTPLPTSTPSANPTPAGPTPTGTPIQDPTPPSTGSGPSITILASTSAMVTAPVSGANSNTVLVSWNAVNATTCTASGAWSGTQPTSGRYTTPSFVYNSSGNNSYTFTLTCIGTGGTSSASTTVNVFAQNSLPDLTGQCGGTTENKSWVYHNGVFTWAGDFTGQGTKVSYNDTSGAPLTGPFDVLLAFNNIQWPYWLPYTQNYSLYVHGCNYLNFAIKPNFSGGSWQTYFMMVGDVQTAPNPDGTTTTAKTLYLGTGNTTSSYGPINPVANQWNVYKIPLQDYFSGEVPHSIYKFSIQDQTGKTGVNNYFDEVYFSGN